MIKNALVISVIAIGSLVNNGAGLPGATAAPERPDLLSGSIISAPCDSPAESGEEFREEFHQTYPLSATGRLGLENVNGSVQVKVWDRPAVQLDAVKRAYKKERLAEAKIVVNASEENIRIKTEYPDMQQNFSSDDRRVENPATVEYSLTVPRKVILESVELINGSLDIDGVEGSVKASSINGRVSVRGLASEAKLSTINGPLEATFDRLPDSAAIYLQSVNGGVTLVIPSDANATIRASTVHGGISNDFGLQVRHGEYVGHDLDGQIGNGGARIKLGNVNGGIRINHAQDGRAISAAVSRIKGNSEEDNRALEQSIEREVEQSTAAEVGARSTRTQSVRIAREAQRQVDVALREAQREVARAQVEVQRETQRQIREQIRVAAAGRGAGSGRGFGNRFTAQESKSFTVTGIPRVNIGTFDGPITVHGWDKSEVMYTATKRAAGEDELKNIAIQAEQQGSSISIIASSEDRSGGAQLEVFVPRNSSLHVSTEDGALNLDGVTGEITLRTGDGPIQVADGGGQVQVNTGDGLIRVDKFQGQLDARTGDGAISLDGDFNSLSARTGGGTISLAVAGGSNFTIETNSEATLSNEGVTITEDLSPSQRVKRWKVGNGGKIFILKTGDGRILLRSR